MQEGGGYCGSSRGSSSDVRAAGIDVWLDEGWAVDAALGEQTRPHKDLDIILQISDLPRLCELLGDRDFRIREGGTESNFVLVDERALEVDVHAIVFDEVGNALIAWQTERIGSSLLPALLVAARFWA